MKPFQLINLMFPLLLLSGCSSFTATPQPVSLAEAVSVKSAAGDFILALASGDADAINRASTVEADPATAQLATLVIHDTAVARQLQLELSNRFEPAEADKSVVGSDAWVAIYQDVLENATMVQAGSRVRIGDETTDGVLFLRKVNGTWKVELVPTLVAESGGRAQVSDPIAEYRFKVSTAVNQMLTTRIEGNEFSSYREYKDARNGFWLDYLALAVNGQDPHDKLLPSLPVVPKNTPVIAENR